MFQPGLSYRQLPELMYQTVLPTPVAAPAWLAFNQQLATELSLPQSHQQTAVGLAMYAGNQLPDWCQPLSQAYAGHQFGQLNPRLGDGRAILLTELINQQGQRVDVQLKGAGATPYSRRGDGRAALGPVLREYLVSEAMHRLGVPTTRALAAVLSGETVYREQPLPGAILTRVAASHLRIGTFQFAAMHGQSADVKALADYAIARHYPAAASAAEPYLAFLNAVIAAQAALVAHWMSLGFVHGVMNTDNMSISGETIDYGPCAFIDRYHSSTVFSSIDTQGRYAYQQQPQIAQWNLARLAETLLPLISSEETQAVELATAALNQFPVQYYQQWRQHFAAKLGLASVDAQDQLLFNDLLQLLELQQIDFTLFFQQLAFAVSDITAATGPSQLFSQPAALHDWAARWQQRLLRDQATTDPASIMQAKNPALIPRNHQVERIISAALQGDLAPFQQFAAALAEPYTAQAQWLAPPADPQAPYRTFCGT